MQGMIRCGLLAGLLVACHTSDPAAPDGSVDGSAGAAGLHVTFSSETAIPGNVEDWLTLDDAMFAFDNLKVLGDAGPGDTRTTATTFSVRWDSSTTPMPIDFTDAPTGLYSKLSFQIDGHVSDESYRMHGQVYLGGVWTPYEIEDRNALSLSLDIDRMLQPGGSATLDLVVKLHDALTSIDFSTLRQDDGHLELGTLDPQMPAFRARMMEAFSADSSGPS